MNERIPKKKNRRINKMQSYATSVWTGNGPDHVSSITRNTINGRRSYKCIVFNKPTCACAIFFYNIA